VNSVVGRGAVMGRYCKVAALDSVGSGEVLEDFAVVFGDGQMRVDKTTNEHAEVREARKVGQQKAVELMARMIPNGSAKWMG